MLSHVLDANIIHKKFVNLIAVSSLCEDQDPSSSVLDINDEEEYKACVTVYSLKNFTLYIDSANKFKDADILVCLNIKDKSLLEEYKNISNQRGWFFYSFPNFTGHEEDYDRLYRGILALRKRKIKQEEEKFVEKSLLLVKASRFDNGSSFNIPSDIIFNITKSMYSHLFFNLHSNFKVNDCKSVMQDEQQKQLAFKK